MTVLKRKLSVSLDAELVRELQAADEALSRQVNEAGRETLVRRRRQRMLTQLLDELSEQHAPVASGLDRQVCGPARVSRCVALDSEGFSAPSEKRSR